MPGIICINLLHITAPSKAGSQQQQSGSMRLPYCQNSQSGSIE
jgi:hypothetical protein